MFGLFKKKTTEITTPVNGLVVDLKEVNDPVFSEKMMGEGFAIKPVDGKICAPVKGTIKSVFPSFHALTLEAEDGLDILIHIGLDTVELDGNGFSSMIQEGQKVDVGELLIQVDLDFLAQNKKDDIVIVVFPEMQDRKLQIKSGKIQIKEVAAILT
ncbi:PTS glucose transporter subunit IIA [Enterococcus dongliensis]|uniref:PTS glucose transporter subunit IIA n=1 Tax=Enterococcus dongliensis TaxID=2559925 RepID=A0AAP5KPQ4_9ENTE|nr:PTS glucose transporter subunit IIA [Enterococcus dongliensis]MDT2596052.1 PTS glucose transporter subunit IIA [Enterococcus dongliensis]MDT2603494.1 PTS glucose transporter subunit IIA [Enterococcus dongliensis]MDT2635296.1 PTS glucose transporter subunit IIA [Enterococcus dongliensis]MDT2636906.1 PTS glucose transporter subunit IIA [Enterococcus dongliensis]MDT2642000.1 PTS glucose transporter subunit IIA [Enterococcus dongliensis]